MLKILTVENYDHKCGITSTKLASKERSPTVASFASTISSHTQLLSLHFREEKQWFLVGVVLNEQRFQRFEYAVVFYVYSAINFVTAVNARFSDFYFFHCRPCGSHTHDSSIKLIREGGYIDNKYSTQYHLCTVLRIIWTHFRLSK